MQLRVLHKSSNFLLVNKHPDLVFNTNPPDTRSDSPPLHSLICPCRLSLYEQISFKFPELVQPNLVHGFYVAHRLDYSTVLCSVFSLPTSVMTSVSVRSCSRPPQQEGHH